MTKTDLNRSLSMSLAAVKKLLAFSVVVIPAMAAQATVSLGSGSSSPGGSVSLDLSLTGGAQPASLEWTMSYSPFDIASVSVAVGSSSAAAGKQVSCSNSSGNTVCIVYGINANTISDGVVATAIFKVAAGSLTTVAPVQITATGADPTGSKVAITGNGGTISITQPVAPVAPALSGLSCQTANVNTPGWGNCTVTLSGPAPATGFNVALTSNNANATVPAMVTVAPGTSTANFTATVTAVATNQTDTLTASAGGVTKTFSLNLLAAQWSISGTTSLLGNGATVTLTGAASVTTTSDAFGNYTFSGLVNGAYTVTPSKAGYVFTPASFPLTISGASQTTVNFTAAPQSTQTSSIFPSSVPPLALNDLTAPTELGVKLRSDVSGVISAVRFYIGDPAGGTYQVHLWDRTGNVLGQSAIVPLSTPGWQVVNLSNPVPITSGTTYVASYHTDNGHYSYTANGFASQGVDNAPLHALANGVDGGNGVYVHGSGFPTFTYQSFNFYVDVVFTPATTQQTSSIFSSSAPPLALNGLTVPSEVGVKLRSDVSGVISAVRFYMGDPAGGTYQVHLWDRTGNILGQSAIVTLSTPGWQVVNLLNPVPITSGTTYVASYHTDNGHYSYTANGFALQGVDNAALHALANGVDGGNGVYVNGSGFPTFTYQSFNFYVDVVFTPGP